MEQNDLAKTVKELESRLANSKEQLPADHGALQR
jgi:hypothetical protein